LVSSGHPQRDSVKGKCFPVTFRIVFENAVTDERRFRPTPSGCWTWREMLPSASKIAGMTATAAPTDGSAFVNPQCQERVLRGGSFNNDPRHLRSAARFKYYYDVRYCANGFRVVREN
jgi:formylglycine-generating enzyme required for sulfatase activity